jgi:hypothetical protein
MEKSMPSTFGGSWKSKNKVDASQNILVVVTLNYLYNLAIKRGQMPKFHAIVIDEAARLKSAENTSK